MLRLTMHEMSHATTTRPWDIVAEHMMPRYEKAVAAFLSDVKNEAKSETRTWTAVVSEARSWSALVGEANSTHELIVCKILNSQCSRMDELLRCGPSHAVA